MFSDAHFGLKREDGSGPHIQISSTSAHLPLKGKEGGKGREVTLKCSVRFDWMEPPFRPRPNMGEKSK